jgi:hypothetical protein
MEFNLFAKNLARIGFNFSNLQITEEYIQFMFDELNNCGFTDQDFLFSVEKIINFESQLFNLPTKACFLQHSNKKPLTDEEMADIEVSRIIEASENGEGVLFDNEITNAAVHQYGGIGLIYFNLFSPFNIKRIPKIWVLKELKEIWLNCKITDKKSNRPSYIKDSRLRDVRFIGDPKKCQQLLDQHNLKIEQAAIPISKCLPLAELIKSNLKPNNQSK